MSSFELARFYDGHIPRAEMRAADEIALGIARTNELLRRCRIGKIVDRRPTAERMAATMARCYRARGECRYADLVEAGFSRAEIRGNAALARGVARRLVERRIATE